MNYTPTPGRVIVKRDEVAEKIGSVFIAKQGQERPTVGVVLAVGDDVQADDGRFIPMQVKEGDRVVFTKHSGNKIQGEDDLWIMQESFILGVIDE